MQTERPKGTIRATVDFDAPGKPVGHLQLPPSEHDDAWGVVPIPVTVIANGTGPTVLMEGGNHGDEYEGPITLCELVRDLDPGAVQGRLIVVPAVNWPAVAAAQRTSPMDGKNMNRCFPGDPLGTATDQIAAYVNDVLFGLSDAFLDLHSGGSSLDILPSAILEAAPDPAHTARNRSAAEAFGTRNVVAIDNRGDPRTATSSAVRAGLTVVGTEMAGAGTVSREALALCRAGVRNVLGHLGVLPGHVVPPRAEPVRTFTLGPGAHALSPAHGVFEPLQALGDMVQAGQTVGRVHDLADIAAPPRDLSAACDGLVFAHRHPGAVKPGGCCVVVAQPDD
jgi:predicted deacylase